MFRTFAYLGLIGTLVLATTAFSQTRDPLGESADYEVDRNRSRTSSMIRSGEISASVTDYLPDAEEGPAYEVTIDYVFVITLIGRQAGSEVVQVPALYFQPEFLEQLRRDGYYESENFKVRHLGYADARTMDGNFYPNCDKIKIYDVQTNKKLDWTRLILGEPLLEAESEIEDLEIEALVYPGVPVLGAVKMDVTGKYRGQNVKAGADYEAP